MIATSLRRSASRGPTVTVLARDVGARDVERLVVAADADAAALTDGEARARRDGARACGPSPSTMAPGRARGPPWRARNASRPVPGQEAEVLGIGLARDRQALALGDLAHLRLRQLAEREAHARDRRRREPGEHVGLVLGRVGGSAQQAVLADARVVAGRELLARRRARRARASRRGARCRCSARTGSASGPRRGRRPTARRRPRGTRRAGRASGAPSPCRWASARAPRTASAEQQLCSRVVLRVAPQLERHRDRLGTVVASRTAAPRRRCRRRRSSPPACGPAARRSPPSACTAVPSARASASAASSAAWSLQGAQSAELVRRSRAGPMRAASSTGAPSDQLHGGAGGGDRRAAAVGVEADVARRGRPDGDADAHEVAAGRRPGDAVVAAVDGDAARVRMTQVLFEALVGHRRRV